jgi:hypothetical protein
MAGGTGLGLFSLLKRVEALNGEVGVTSRADLKQGSMFWFTFPYRPDEESSKLATTGILEADESGVIGSGSASAWTRSERSVSDPQPLKPSNILLIDDSQSVLRYAHIYIDI